MFFVMSYFPFYPSLFYPFLLPSFLPHFFFSFSLFVLSLLSILRSLFLSFLLFPLADSHSPSPPYKFSCSLISSSCLFSGPLLKAVTSAKLSPRGKYALVGYGVRNQGVVEDHPYRCALTSVLTVLFVI